MDILPELGANAVTVRVPADVVEGGNQAAEVTYDAVPPLIATLTTSAVMPVIQKFVVTVTFDQDVTPLPGTAEGDVKWYFSPAEDLTISHGTYVGYEKITNRVYDVMIRPSRAVGTLVVALPERKVATGRTTDVWNLATSIDVAAGKRSVTFEQATYSVGEGDDVVIRVILDEDPLNTVVIPITSTTHGGAVVSGDYEALPSSVTFNSGETEKTFTFTAIDDDLDDDGESVTIAIGSPLPGIIVTGVTHETTVNIDDDDEAGVTVSETALEVPEGQQDTYTVVLDTQPNADVTMTIEGVAGTDLALDKPTLTFTAQDWNTTQTVTVTAGQDHDAVDDTATLTHEVSSADTDYDGLSAGVDVTVADDDTAGITATPRIHHVTEGENAHFTVVLNTQPTEDVRVKFVRVGPATLVFTPQNWSRPQHKIVGTWLDTDTIDTLYGVTMTATGGDYDGLKAGPVKAYARDGDPVMRFSLQEVGPVNEDAGTVRVTVRAVTNENGAPRIDYPVKVQSREDTALAGSDYQEVNETLWFAVDDFEEFENDNGQTRYRQTAYLDVRILEDISAEGTESFGLILESLADYRWPAYGVRRIEVPIIDNDSPGVTVTPTELTVAEGSSDTYTVVLGAQPNADVTVTIGGVAGTDLSLDEPTLTFTAQDWNTPQTVTVTAGQDDDAVDDTVALTHAVSSANDSEYDGLSADGVDVTVADDDRVRVNVSETSLGIEEGGLDTYTVVLDTQPTGDVTVTIEGVAGTDLSLDKTTLTFTAQDWNTTQTVTVTAGQDHDGVDDTAALAHTVTSVDDANYNGLSVRSVDVTVTDDDTVGVTVSETSLTMEEGGLDTYTVVLDTQPTGDVTVTIDGIAGTDLSLDKTTLTFTAQDWNTTQTVTVTAGQDGDAVDDTATLTHAVSSANDTDYNGLSADVVVTVADDDTAGVTVTPTELTVAEGSSNTYTVVLDTQPNADVTMTIEGVAGTDLALDKPTLTFTAQDWNTTQTVTVTAGQDHDAVDDTAALTHEVSSANDSDYDGLSPRRCRHRGRRRHRGCDGDSHGVDGCRREFEHLHRGPGYPTQRGRHDDHRGRRRYGPGAGQAHTHLHGTGLEHHSDGDGDGGAGPRRRR